MTATNQETTMTTTTQALIDDSIREQRIVHIDRARLADADMLALWDAKDDTVLVRDPGEDGEKVTRQFWGADEDGDEWRVHVEGIDGSDVDDGLDAAVRS